MYVWYVSYGSNMHAARLRHYLAGGRPPGGARTCPGCRDPRPPVRSAPVVLPGCMYFALESRNWTGGVAFYDPDGPGEVWGRAHLVTAGQFSDIAAQEMHRAPSADLDLAAVLARGRVQLGPGRYETLVHPGSLDGLPLLTFTAPWSADEVAHSRPTDTYLAHLASGLREAGGWDDEQIAGYLEKCRLGVPVRTGASRAQAVTHARFERKEPH
ncbi:histone deacetylase [Streptomyces sp. NPDC017529]|uniref:histone deacetylase n=1 Tax=Streptomyces sp. NPDC017529 TaxID=3365000 RepID=UPI00378CF72F